MQVASISSSAFFTPTIGFASNLSRTIIREAQEDDTHSVASHESDESSVSITDEELALHGAPWAKEGMLTRKQYWEATGKRAKNKAWMNVFAVISKGEMKMFTFGEGHGMGADILGGGNWLVCTCWVVLHRLPDASFRPRHSLWETSTSRTLCRTFCLRLVITDNALTASSLHSPPVLSTSFRLALKSL